MDDKTRKVVYNSKSIGNILSKFATSFQFKLLSFYKDKEIVDLIKGIKKEVNFAFYPYEAYMIYDQFTFDGSGVGKSLQQGS